MEKALIVSTNLGFIANFEQNDIRLLQEMGYEVHCAANESLVGNMKNLERLLKSDITVHDICFNRNPGSTMNIRAMKALRLLMEKEHFSLVHCHTPVAAACTRIALGKYRKRGLKIIYTAHGFHFFKGAPLKNWIMFYPLEKMLSHKTDVIITINKEDYERAKKRLFAGKTVYIPGIGIDTERFGRTYESRKSIREELSIPQEAKLLISIGELSVRKNHKVIIEAMARIKTPLYYIEAGKGSLDKTLEEMAERLGLSGRVKLLGYRTDIPELLAASDLFVFPSLQEGLPVALMEAMASGLPCVVSRIRGNTDLIETKELMFEPTSVDQAISSIEYALSNDMHAETERNKEKIKEFDIIHVSSMMKTIYMETANNTKS